MSRTRRLPRPTYNKEQGHEVRRARLQQPSAFEALSETERNELMSEADA
jgi:hypothetical protein